MFARPDIESRAGREALYQHLTDGEAAESREVRFRVDGFDVARPAGGAVFPLHGARPVHDEEHVVADRAQPEEGGPADVSAISLDLIGQLDHFERDAERVDGAAANV